MKEGYFDKEKGWVGKPLPWSKRNFWCKIGMHRWGAPWCIECGYPDEILQDAISRVFNDLSKSNPEPPK